MNNKLSLFLISTLLLSACGGGGGGDTSSNAPQKPPAPRLNITMDSEGAADESSSSSVTLNTSYTGNATVTYAVESTDENIATGSVTNGALVVNINDVSAVNSSVTLTVTASDGSLSDTASTTLTINNVSFWNDYDTLSSKVAAASDYLSFDTSVNNTLVYLTDIEVLMGEMAVSEFNTVLNSRTQDISTATTDALDTINILDSTLATYTTDSDATESDLVTANALLDDALEVYASKAVSILDRSSAFSVAFSANSIDSLHFDNGSYSLFVGNPNLGAFDDNQWTFNSQSQFIASLTATQSCIASQAQ